MKRKRKQNPERKTKDSKRKENPIKKD